MSWNADAERLSGYAADEMLGRPVSLLIPPDRSNEVAHFREKLKRGSIAIDSTPGQGTTVIVYFPCIE